MATDTRATLALTYGPYTFSADLPAKIIPECPRPMFNLADVHALEQAAARWIIEHGVTAPETLRALRAAAGLTGAQLGELLGTDRAVVSRWENAHNDPGIALWNTLAALALDAMEGSTRTADRLRATQTERQMGGEIRLAVAQ